MTQLQKEYVEKEFEPFLIESKKAGDKVYRITNKDAFELFKKYSHLYTYFESGALSELSLFSDTEEHILEFKI